MTVHSGAQTLTQRRQAPYGTIRAAAGTWPSTIDKGFVGGTVDNTGLTHLGAREYDPLTGRFLSVDPVIDHGDPQQLHGYSYANGNPVTMSDPDGRLPSWIPTVASNVRRQVQAHVNTAKHIGNAVGQAASTAAAKVGSAAVATGKWLYDNSGTISAVAGVVALVTPPPVNAIAGGISFAFGVVDTIKSCSEKKAVDCAVSAASLVPGVRALSTGAKVTRAGNVLKASDEALRDARNGIDIAKAGYDEALLAVRNPVRNATVKWELRNFDATIDQAMLAKEEALRVLNKWTPIYQQWNRVDTMFAVEEWTFTNCRWSGSCADDRQDTLFKPRTRPSGPTPPTRPAPPSGGGGSHYAPATNPWGGGAFE